MFQKTTLKNGLVVATDSYTSVETSSLGLFVKTGSRAESLSEHGVSHFLEHMAFKGTSTRSSFDIMAQIEDVGGDLDAYTSRDSTAYFSKVLKEDVPLAVELLSDIVQNSLLKTEDVTKECDVILQEYKEATDTPSDIIFDDLQNVCFPGQPLGRTILGTEESIKSISSESLKNYIQKHYTAENMLLCAAGNVDHDALVALVEKSFDNLPSGKMDALEKATYVGGTFERKRDIMQCHSVVAYEGLNHDDDLYFAGQIWSSIVGGSMTSRMFQKVREELGLAYMINSFMNSYADTGVFGVYAATDKEKQQELKSVIEAELKASLTNVTEAEVKRARTQFKAGLMMYLESSDNRMSRLANNLITRGRYVTSQELVEKIEAVTLEQVKAAAAQILESKQSYVTVG